MKKIIITIDGHSACGKSTLAKALASELNYGYIDTGAMYRAVTFYFLENRVNIQKTAEMERALKKINITFKNTVGGNRTFLNGIDVEDVIRKMFVSKNVSHVAAISMVRKMVVKQQMEMGRQKGIVMEGRDIGTVVFPKAELKMFLTADPDVRTKRRYDELKKKGQRVSMKSIKDNLLERDHIDSTRKDSPLKKAKEAILIDNSNLTQSEQLAMVLALSKERIKKVSASAAKPKTNKSTSNSSKNTKSVTPLKSKAATNRKTNPNQNTTQKTTKPTTTKKNTNTKSDKNTNQNTTKNRSNSLKKNQVANSSTQQNTTSSNSKNTQNKNRKTNQSSSKSKTPTTQNTNNNSSKKISRPSTQKKSASQSTNKQPIKTKTSDNNNKTTKSITKKNSKQSPEKSNSNSRTSNRKKTPQQSNPKALTPKQSNKKKVAPKKGTNNQVTKKK